MDKTHVFSAYLEKAAHAWGLSGCVLIRYQGKQIFSQGTSNKYTPQTIFHIASLTKQFTASAILKLQEEKKLSIQDPITQYLPKKYLPQTDTWDQITIHHLLTHRSGLPNFNKPYEVPEFSEIQNYSVAELVALFKDKPLLFQPGSERRYNNSAYILLGIIIEDVSQKPYGDYLRETLFSPLEMNASGFIGDENYFKHPRAKGYIDAPYELYTKAFAAGGLYSTCADLDTWEQSLETETVLSKKSLHLMFDVKQIPEYGYGWFIDRAFGKKRILHHGSIAGYNTSLCRYPDSQSCIILLTNSHFPAAKIDEDLSAILFDKPYTHPRHRDEIDTSAFPSYAGVYKLPNNETVTISDKGDNRLFFQPTDEPEGEIIPVSENAFIYKKWLIEFDKSQLILEPDDEEPQIAQKI